MLAIKGHDNAECAQYANLDNQPFVNMKNLLE